MADKDPIDEFIALPRDQQLSTLQSLSPEKQDKLLLQVKQRRTASKGPAPRPGAEAATSEIRALTPIERATAVWEPNPRTETPLQQAETVGHDILAGVNQVFYHPIDTIRGMGEALMRPDQAIRSLYQSALTQPVGTLASTVGQSAALGPLTEIGGEAVRGLAPRVAKAVPHPLEAVTGTGPRALRKLVKETTKANAADLDKYQADLDKARGEHSAELLKLKQKYAQDVRDANAKYQTDVGKRSDAVLKLKQKYEADVRAAQEEHRVATEKAEAANAEKVRQYNRKIGETVEKNRGVEAAKQAETTRQGNIQVQGSQIIDRINRLDQRVRQEANAKYDAVREKVGAATEPGQSLGAAARQALQKISGSTERPKIFRDILEKYPEAEPDFIEDPTPGRNSLGRVPKSSPYYNILKSTLNLSEAPPVSFADLQGYYTELGSELSRGTLPADVYLATKALQESVGDLMQRMANKAGAGKDLIEARKFYRDYMDTFHEPTGPSGSGSPVAQAVNAKDPARAVDAFSGKSGDRGVAMLRRYDPELANLALEAQRNARSKAPAPRATKQPISSIAQPKLAPAPGGPSLPLPPVLPPEVRGPSLPLPPVLPPEPEAVVPRPIRRTINVEDAQEAKAESLQKRADRIRHLGDLASTWPLFYVIRDIVRGHAPNLVATGGEMVGTAVIGHALSAMLENPRVVKFLTKATARDVAAIPEDLRGDLPAIVDRAKSQGVKVSPALTNAVRGAAALAPRRQEHHPTDVHAGTTAY